MDNPENKYNYWKLSTLLALALLLTALFLHKTVSQLQTSFDLRASKTTQDFLVVKVGDFSAEIRWNSKHE
jgi:uncharacterized protein YpmS